jgi:hypothetical protein
MRITVLYAKPKMAFPIGSWLIRLVEGTQGSHVALSIELSETHAAFDSVVPVSRVITKARWDDHYETLKEWSLELPGANPSDVMSWILDNTDRRYSRWQCILLGLGDFCGGWVRTLVRKQNPNGNEYLICVEAVVRFLMRFADMKFTRSPDTIGLEEFIGLMDQK